MTQSPTRISTRILTTLLLLACSAAWNVFGLEQLDPNDFSKKMTVSFENCGIDDNAALMDFPALVIFDASVQPSLNYAAFSAGAANLRFADADGMEIPYEIDAWNPAGRSFVWVRIPELTSNTVVTAYWGGQSQAPSYTGADNVWANGYVGVWHFNESALPVKDSSPKGNNFTTSDGAVTFSKPAAGNGIGNVIGFAGGANRVSAPNHASLSGMAQMTIEMLACYRGGDLADINGLLVKRTSSNSQVAFAFFKIDKDIRLDTSTSSQARTTLGKAPQIGEWAHIAMVYDGTNPTYQNRVRAYFNNLFQLLTVPSGVPASISNSNSLLHLGYMDGETNKRGWNGEMDEVRISNVARSEAWLGANHATITSPETFAAYGVVANIDDSVPAVTTLSAQVGALGVEVFGQLISDGGSLAKTALYWGGEDAGANAAAWDYAITNDAPISTGANFSTNLLIGTHLNYARTYFARHAAFNSSAEAWSPNALSFTTPGAPVFGSPSASIDGRAITFSVEVEKGVAASVDAQLLVGASPGALEPFGNGWTLGGAGAQELVGIASNRTVGVTYYYAFTASGAMPDDGGNIVFVSTATNSIALSGVTTWTNAISGDWNDDANWDNGVPGSAAQANFYKAGATVTANADLAVAQAMVNTNGVTTFDLGGNTLAVSDRLDIGGNAAEGFPVRGASTLSVLNGKLDLAGAALYIGNGSARGSEDNALALSNSVLSAAAINIGSAQNARRSAMLLQDSAATNSGVLSVGGSYGASNSGITLRRSSLLNKGSVTVAGAGTSTSCFLDVLDGSEFISEDGIGVGAQASSNCRVIVSNSVVKTTNLNLANFASVTNITMLIKQDADRIARVEASGNVVTWQGANSGIIVDGGTLAVTGHLGIGSIGSFGHRLSVINGGKVTTDNLRIGAEDSTKTNAALDNVAEFIGERATLQAANMVIGRNPVQSRGTLHINGGAVTVANQMFVGHSGSTNNTVRISGATARLAGPTTARFFNNSTIIFDIPEEGFTNGIDGKSVVTFIGAAEIDDSFSLEINAGDFVGRARLFQSAAGLPGFADNAKVNIAQGSASKFVSSPDGKWIDFIASRNGTILIIR